MAGLPGGAGDAARDDGSPGLVGLVLLDGQGRGLVGEVEDEVVEVVEEDDQGDAGRGWRVVRWPSRRRCRPLLLSLLEGGMWCGSNWWWDPCGRQLGTRTRRVPERASRRPNSVLGSRKVGVLLSRNSQDSRRRLKTLLKGFRDPFSVRNSGVDTLGLWSISGGKAERRTMLTTFFYKAVRHQ